MRIENKDNIHFINKIIWLSIDLLYYMTNEVDANIVSFIQMAPFKQKFEKVSNNEIVIGRHKKFVPQQNKTEQICYTVYCTSA